MRKTHLFEITICALIALISACSPEVETADQHVAGPTIDNRPNILLIIVDDMGYTDLGVYGGEIDTPNLDLLARDGLILTDFHNQASCAPTRAAILSGTDNHNAGGSMGARHQAPNQRGVAGYEPYLNEDVVAFPALLQQAGYNTYLAGKWHLGSEPHQTPNARGFDRSFALMQGVASHYHDRVFSAPDNFSDYKEDGRPFEELPEDFYSTNFYTNYLIDAIDKDRHSGDPWFAYLSYTAPHWPLQAPDEDIAKYKGHYDEGYEVLRRNRIAKAKALGIFLDEAETYPRLQRVPAWESLSDEEQAKSSKEMEIYAAMVDVLDQNIGRLIDHLRDIGEYDNTFIVFISDNGAEGRDRFNNDFDNSFENMGRIHSHLSYGAGWAQAGSGVMRYFKAFSSEGGTRAPAIIHYPEKGVKGVISDAFTSVVDLAPTFLELAEVEHPDFGYNGRPLKPLQGHSLAPLAFGDADSVWPNDFVYGWEVFGHLAIRKGDWKLLRLMSTSAYVGQPTTERADSWGLYNVSVDPGETNDLSESLPEKVRELLDAWDEYSTEHGLVIPQIQLSDLKS